MKLSNLSSCRPRRLFLFLTTPTISFAPLAYSQQTGKASISGSANYRLAFEAIAEHRLDDALQLAQKLAATNAASKAEREAIEAWVDFVRCRFESASAKARTALVSNPKQPLALMVRARLLASENSLAEAELTARAAVTEDSDNPVVLWWCADVLGYSRKDVATRDKWIERVVTLGGTPEIANSRSLAAEALDYDKKLADRPTEVVTKSARGQLSFTRTAATGFLARIQLPLSDGRVQQVNLDTGAGMLMLPNALLPSVRGDSLGQGSAYALTGHVTIERKLLDSLALGDMNLKSVPAGGLPGQVGLLGMNLFRNNVLVVDLANSRIVAYSDHALFEKEWGENLKRADRVNFRMFKNGAFVSARFKTADGKETEGAIFLDTGANVTALNTPFAQAWSKEDGVKLAQGGTMPIMGAAGGQQTRMQSIQNVTIQAGATNFQFPQMRVLDLGSIRNAVGVDLSALVGIDVLGRRQFVVFDFQKRQVYFGPQ